MIKNNIYIFVTVLYCVQYRIHLNKLATLEFFNRTKITYSKSSNFGNIARYNLVVRREK